MRIPTVPAIMMARKTYSCRRSITEATYIQSSSTCTHNKHEYLSIEGGPPASVCMRIYTLVYPVFAPVAFSR